MGRGQVDDTSVCYDYECLVMTIILNPNVCITCVKRHKHIVLVLLHILLLLFYYYYYYYDYDYDYSCYY